MITNKIRALLFAGTAALASVTTSTTPASAQAVEIDGFLGAVLKSPFMESAQAIATVSSPLSNRSKNDELDKFYKKIETIVENQARIVSELSGIGFVMQEKLREGFLENTVQKLQGEMFAYKVLRTMPDTTEKNFQKNEIAQNIDRVAAEIYNYNDVAVMPAYFAAVGALTYVHKDMDSSQQTLDAVLSPHYKNLNAQLDPVNSIGVAGKKRLLETNINEDKKFLDKDESYLIGWLPVVIYVNNSPIISNHLYSLKRNPGSDSAQNGLAFKSEWSNFIADETSVKNLSLPENPVSRFHPYVAFFTQSKLECLRGDKKYSIPVSASNGAIRLPEEAQNALDKNAACVRNHYNAVATGMRKDQEVVQKLTVVEEALVTAYAATGKNIQNAAGLSRP